MIIDPSLLTQLYDPAAVLDSWILCRNDSSLAGNEFSR